jgi:hypothetical protein
MTKYECLREILRPARCGPAMLFIKKDLIKRIIRRNQSIIEYYILQRYHISEVKLSSKTRDTAFKFGIEGRNF